MIRDTWDANVLALSVKMLLHKSFDGNDVGLILLEPEQVVGLLMWTKRFGAVHSFVSFDLTTYYVKTVSFGMFVWAAKCSFISESELCEKLKRFHGALLFQVVGLCHGFGLVDEDVGGFVRCVHCVFCGCVLVVIVVLLRAGSDCSILRMGCLCLSVGAWLRRELVRCRLVVFIV